MLTKLICRNFKNFGEVEEAKTWNIEDWEEVDSRYLKSV